MKTITNLILWLLSATLIATVATSCDKDESTGGAELSALSYATGEVALGNTVYKSAAPSIFLTSQATFSITKVTQNGQVLGNTSPEVVTIDEKTGIITANIKATLDYVGEYKVSVRVKSESASRDYSDIFRLVVKGIAFESDAIAINKGEATTIKVKDIFLSQEEGTLFYLVKPKTSIAEDYEGISVDSVTCAINLDANVPAGVYPVSIMVKNLTNPKGFTFNNVTTITVESKPYDLVYSPATITLITSEGHNSAIPTIRAASATQGIAVTYSLGNNFDNQFTINPTTGVISILEGNTLPDKLETYKLSVKAKNNLGEVTFQNAYTVIIDPDKVLDPITNVVYPDEFPVVLNPGQPWQSKAPTFVGSTIGLKFSLKDAPMGVSIDSKTGVITMAAQHHMPLKTVDNFLIVETTNSGKEICTTSVGNFEIDATLWKPIFKINTNEQLTNSGIANMDRYSFLGKMYASGTVQVKNGLSKSSGGDFIDVVGVNTAGAPAGGINQNNDWLVSENIVLNSYALDPKITFDLGQNYGTDIQNILDIYILDNTGDVYGTAGAQEQIDGTLESVPTSTASTLNWVPIAQAIHNTANGDVNNAANFSAKTVDIPSQYKGKTIRFAIRYSNPTANNNNSRTYRIKNLKIEEAIPTTNSTSY